MAADEPTGWGYDVVMAAVRTRVYPVVIGGYVLVRLVGFAVLAILADHHDRPVFDLMKAWDGDWYLSIAEYGYDNVPARLTDANGHHTRFGPLAFYPLVPWLIRSVATTGVGPLAAGMIVSLVAGCVAACGLFRIARMVDPRTRTGYLLVVLWAGMPMAITLSMTYTEALFSALAAWALVGVLERRWFFAGLCAAAAGLVRPTASVLVAIVVVASLGAAFRDRRRSWPAAVIAPLGLLGWWGYVAARTGSLTGWFDLERDGWRTGFDFGRETFRFVGHVLATGNSVMEVVDVLVLLAAIVLAVLVVRSRLPWPLWAYGAGVVLFVVTTAAINYGRIRFLLPGFTVLIPVAHGLANRTRGTIVAVSVAYVLFGAWFSAYALTAWHFAI
jgi:hypothetical protein